MAFLKLYIAFYVAIVFHEVGHYLVAKAFKLEVLIVAFGAVKVFAPRIGNTRFLFGLVPIWGYIECPQQDNLPLYKKWIYGVAGVATNLLLCSSILFIVFGGKTLEFIQYIANAMNGTFFQKSLFSGNPHLSIPDNHMWIYLLVANFLFAVFNIIPIPPLDFGQIAFDTLESILYLLKVPKENMKSIKVSVFNWGFIVIIVVFSLVPVIVPDIQRDAQKYSVSPYVIVLIYVIVICSVCWIGNRLTRKRKKK